MNKKFKRIMSVILCAVLLFTTASTAFAAEDGRKVIDSGFCGAQGENLTWTLYDDGELVISGEGDTAFYYICEETLQNDSPLIPPWYDYYKEDIEVITIEEGVTGIDNDAFFCDDSDYYRVNLPKSLRWYDDKAFSLPDDGAYVNIVICYPGTYNDWNNVVSVYYSFVKLNEDFTQVVSFNKKNTPIRGLDIEGELNENIYFNGDEPNEVRCILKSRHYYKKINAGETDEIRITYYALDHDDVKLVWRTEGDGCDIEYHTSVSGSGYINKATVTSVRHGDFSVIVELVDSDGTVLATQRKDYFSYVPDDMTFLEKTEEFFTVKIPDFFEAIIASFSLLGIGTGAVGLALFGGLYDVIASIFK